MERLRQHFKELTATETSSLETQEENLEAKKSKIVREIEELRN